VAPSGSNIAIQYAVKNFGTANATATWYDYVLFSNDLAIGNDTAIAVTARSTDLAAGAGYTVFLPQVPLPVVPAGTYYLFLHVDGSNAVMESNENNNIGAVQIIVTP
jgi:subtilase family serine protease